tara:strand:+ start:142 stop:603 length:462 start_codon:yes stop_codon:yes gene_type:complete
MADWTHATKQQKGLALAELAKGQTYKAAARAAGVASDSTVWRWVNNSEAYRQELQEAKRAALASAAELVLLAGKEIKDRLEDDEKREAMSVGDLNKIHGTATDKIIHAAAIEAEQGMDESATMDAEAMLDALAERLTPEHLAALQARMADLRH